MFKDLVEKMSEENLDSFFCDLQDDHAYFSRQWQMLIAGSRQLESQSAQFIDGALAEAAHEFALALQRLSNGVSANFCTYGSMTDRGFRYCLHPHWNMDRASQIPTRDQERQYRESARELREKVNDAQAHYVSFRSLVKRTLAV